MEGQRGGRKSNLNSRGSSFDEQCEKEKGRPREDEKAHLEEKDPNSDHWT